MSRILLFGWLFGLAQVQAMAQSATSRHMGWLGEQLPILWECSAKYSPRVVRLRAYLSELSPRLYVESENLGVFIGPEHALGQRLWQTQGGTHLCFKGQGHGAANFYFFQMTPDVFLPMSRSTNVKAELQIMPNPQGLEGCDQLAKIGLFHESEFMTCHSAGRPATPQLSRATGAEIGFPDPSVGMQGLVPQAAQTGIQRLRGLEHLDLNKETQSAAVLISGQATSGEGTYSSILIVGKDGTVSRHPMEDIAFSQFILERAGLTGQNAPAGVGVVYHSVIALPQNHVLVSGTIALRTNDSEMLHRGFVAGVTPTGTLDTKFGTGGVVFFGRSGTGRAALQNLGYQNQYPYTWAIGLPDGRIVVSHTISETSGQGANQVRTVGVRMAMLTATGQLISQFGTNLAKNKNFTDRVSRRLHLQSLAVSKDGTIYAAPTSGVILQISSLGELTKEISIADQSRCSVGFIPREKGFWTSAWCDRGELNLRRYDGDGSVDSSFGSAGNFGLIATLRAQGVSHLRLSTRTRPQFIELKDGKILVSFIFEGQLTRQSFRAMARLNQDGTIDTTFDPVGVQILEQIGSADTFSPEVMFYLGDALMSFILKASSVSIRRFRQ